MPEQLLKKFSIEVQEKLYETQQAEGTLAVFHTYPFGKLLTRDGEIIYSEQDSFFYHEMMTHPALFSHPYPQKIVVIGHYAGIMNEILKHTTVTHLICVQDHPVYDWVINEFFPELMHAREDQRISVHHLSADQWLGQTNEPVDIIIDTRPVDIEDNCLEKYYLKLREHGILVKSFLSLLLHVDTLKKQLLSLKHSRFADWQLLNFPQPSYHCGSRSVLLALTDAGPKWIPEKKIFNRAFSTRYYNLDTHKAALVLPEFMREWDIQC